jgi:MFS family permease
VGRPWLSIRREKANAAGRGNPFAKPLRPWPIPAFRKYELPLRFRLDRHPSLWPPLAAATALLIAYLSTAAPGITWANHGADGGDLVTAVVSWGVPHPSGYPTYLLLGRLFLAWPGGTAAYRLVLLSAASMALAAGILAALAASCRQGMRWKMVAGLAAGLGFGLAPLPWSQAVIAEVYGLNVFCVALILVLIASLSVARRSRRGEVALALAAGLGLGNHLTILLMVPPLAAALMTRWRSGECRRAAVAGIAFIFGLAVYGILPLLARHHALVNWGNASTWTGFWWLVSGGTYRGMVFGLPLSDMLQRLGSAPRLLLAQFGPVGLGLIGVGLVFGRSPWPWLDRTAIWIAAVYSLFALGYNAPDSSNYLIPALAGLAWFLALGLSSVLSWAESWRQGAAVPVIGIVGVLALVRLPSIIGQVDARHDLRATEYIRAVLHQAPADALVLTSTDQDSFPLWYAQSALGQRPDLRLVVVPLGQFEWYRRDLGTVYPDLDLPIEGPTDVWTWETELLKRNPRPICQTEIVGEGAELVVRLRCDAEGAVTLGRNQSRQSFP